MASPKTATTNREICDRFMEAYRLGRLDDVIAMLDPGIEWHTTELWVEREVWFGRGRVRSALERFFAEWEEFSNDLEEFRDGGDRFAIVSTMRGVSRLTGIRTEMKTSGVCEVRNGLIVRIVGYSDPADALKAVEG